MMAMVMVFLSAMTLSLMPDDFGALGEGIEHDFERCRSDARGKALFVDAALLQREAVREYANSGAGELCQVARAGARPGRQHTVLDQKQRDLVLPGGKLCCEIATEPRVVGVERV